MTSRLCFLNHDIQLLDQQQAAGSEASIKKIAGQLSIPIINSKQISECDFVVFFEGAILKLKQISQEGSGSIWVDFSKGKSAYRQKHQSKGKLPISRACGLKQNHRPSIIDATAGLGQDAFMLASLGCEVFCIEQSPVLAALLADGLARAKQADPWLQDIASRMHLRQDRAEQVLALEKADVVYLDPMFPHQQNRKQAKVKKAMQLLRAFPGTESDEKTLLEAALSAAVHRLFRCQGKIIVMISIK